MSEQEFEQGFTPKFKTGPKEKPTCNWVIEVTAKVRAKMISEPRIYSEWQSCRVLNFTLVTRCFKCQGFGHIAKVCENKDICSICAQEGHSHRTCKNKEKAKVCANCKKAKRPANHNVMDRKCPCYERARNILVQNTDYKDGAY